MEQSTESGDVSIRKLGGLNQRVSPLDLPLNEFSVLEGYYPSQQGLLSRLPGKEKLFQLVGRVMSIHPTYNSSGHVLIQTDENLYLTTVDEIQGRVITTSLSTNPNPDPGGSSSGDTTPPTQPTNLAASNIASGSLMLEWTASTDNVAVTSYSVYSGLSGGALTLYSIVTTNTASIVGLTASTAYDFYVEANDAAGNVSTASATLTATTIAGGGDVTPPTTPGSLSAISTTQTTVAMTWTASTDAVGVTGYIIYSRIGNSGTFSQAGTVMTITFTATGLQPNTTYNFQVKAFDAAGNISSASNTLSAITDGTPIIPITSELIIYWKATAGSDGGNWGLSNAKITDISIPDGTSSFLLSNSTSQIQLPEGTYLFESFTHQFSSTTGTKYIHKVDQSISAVTNSDTQTNNGVRYPVTHALSVYAVINGTYVGIVGNATTLTKAANLGEQEIYMMMKVTKLA